MSDFQIHGEPLRMLRTIHGISAKDLSTLVGVTRGYITGAERDRWNLSREITAKVLDVFGVSEADACAFVNIVGGE